MDLHPPTVPPITTSALEFGPAAFESCKILGGGENKANEPPARPPDCLFNWEEIQPNQASSSRCSCVPAMGLT